MNIQWTFKCWQSIVWSICFFWWNRRVIENLMIRRQKMIPNWLMAVHQLQVSTITIRIMKIKRKIKDGLLIDRVLCNFSQKSPSRLGQVEGSIGGQEVLPVGGVVVHLRNVHHNVAGVASLLDLQIGKVIEGTLVPFPLPISFLHLPIPIFIPRLLLLLCADPFPSPLHSLTLNPTLSGLICAGNRWMLTT